MIHHNIDQMEQWPISKDSGVDITIYVYALEAHCCPDLETKSGHKSLKKSSVDHGKMEGWFRLSSDPWFHQLWQ